MGLHTILPALYMEDFEYKNDIAEREEKIMREKILEICEYVDDTVDFSGDSLVDDKILDSITLVEIISEIAETFDIEIPYEEIIPENFNSVDAMTRMVEKYV